MMLVVRRRHGYGERESLGGIFDEGKWMSSSCLTERVVEEKAKEREWKIES